MASRIRIRTTARTVHRDQAGRFASRGAVDTVRYPAAHPPGDLPTWVILDDGTRLRTTSRRGRASLALFEALEPLLARSGLTFPDTARLHHAKQAYSLEGIPAAWLREPEGSRPEAIEEPQEGFEPEYEPPRPSPVPVPRSVPTARVSRHRAPRASDVRREPRRATAYRVVVVRRDRHGRFNSRGRTVQRVRVPVKQKGRA